jgi:hypothetical protein
LNTDTGIGKSPSGIEFPPTTFIEGPTKDEDIALSGQRGYRPRAEIEGSNVFIDGISVPYDRSGTACRKPLTLPGNAAAEFPIIDFAAPFPYPLATFGGVQGQIRQTIMGDRCLARSRASRDSRTARWKRSSPTRPTACGPRAAGIRLPVGTRMEVFITVVNNPTRRAWARRCWAHSAPAMRRSSAGTSRCRKRAPRSHFRMRHARSRRAPSDSSRKATTRPGSTMRGPAVNRRQEVASGFDPDTLPRLLPESGPPAALLPPFTPPFAEFPNGITIFPGGFPLYRNGVLVGAIGISGDGVDQDDIVGASGTERFLAPSLFAAIASAWKGRASPTAKFPRDPEGFDRISPFVIPGVFRFRFERQSWPTSPCA